MSCKTWLKRARETSVFPLALLFTLLPLFLLTAAPKSGPYAYQDGYAIAIKEMRDSIDDLRHEINNHEAEIRTFDEKLTNLDSIIESVRDQFSDVSKSHKEQLKGSSANLEQKISSLEATEKGMVADLKQFKTHANETSTLLTQYKQKIESLEKTIDQQNQNIENLQAAMQSLMEALQVKPAPASKNASKSSVAPQSSTSSLSYKVKAGDSLEKIARSHQVTIQALKEANGLITDRIVVGKNLIIPE